MGQSASGRMAPSATSPYLFFYINIVANVIDSDKFEAKSKKKWDSHLKAVESKNGTATPKWNRTAIWRRKKGNEERDSHSKSRQKKLRRMGQPPQNTLDLAEWGVVSSCFGRPYFFRMQRSLSLFDNSQRRKGQPLKIAAKEIDSN